MIRLETILTPARSLVNVPGGSKKRVLEQIANLVARDLTDLDAQDIFENLIAREKLGSTGFGNGIAIPHCRLPGCQAPISAVLIRTVRFAGKTPPPSRKRLTIPNSRVGSQKRISGRATAISMIRSSAATLGTSPLSNHLKSFGLVVLRALARRRKTKASTKRGLLVRASRRRSSAC